MSKLATFEGINENRHVTLPLEAGIPDQTRVHMAVPTSEGILLQSVASPHFANPEQAKDFEKRTIEDTANAKVGFNS